MIRNPLHCNRAKASGFNDRKGDCISPILAPFAIVEPRELSLPSKCKGFLIIGIILLLLCAQGYALELPWLTGPLLAPTPFTVKTGHVAYQPYVYWIKKTGGYDQQWHSQPVRHLDTLLLQPLTKFGIFPRGELDVVPQLLYRSSEGPHAWNIGDLPVGLSVQAVREDKQLNWTWPDVKLRLDVVLPLGRYDRLKPLKYQTDSSGDGSFFPGFSVLTGKFFHLTDTHWLTVRLAYRYAWGVSTRVHGLSVYGGTEQTRGTVRPGNLWSCDLGLEATLTRRIALACDLEVAHTDKARFWGKSGGIAPAPPSSDLWIVAPAIEYNHSARVGMIFGPSITFAGRNAPDAIAWIFSMNIRPK